MKSIVQLNGGGGGGGGGYCQCIIIIIIEVCRRKKPSVDMNLIKFIKLFAT